MKIILSHKSALELLRASNTACIQNAMSTRHGISGKPLSDTQAAHLAQELALSLPLHILLPREKKHPRTDCVIYHTCNGPLPGGSLLHVNNTVTVTSPELTFIELASSENIFSHVALGYEFCGFYRMDGRYNQEPLTSVSRLKAYLTRVSSMHGLKQACRAFKYVLPNSASYMETVLSMLWTLPSLLGGYMLTPPELNARLDPGKWTKNMTSKSFYKCDLYWKDSRLAVEYDSNQWHTGSQRIAEDSKRRDELSALGINVITITANQIYNFAEFDKVTHSVARRLKKRLPQRTRAFTDRQLELRASLIPTFATQI